MKKRKKLSEMTPYERVLSRMKDMSWEEAEEVGVEILARCLAMHVYSRKDGEEYFLPLLRHICQTADKWASSDFGSHYLAMARIGFELEKENDKLKEPSLCNSSENTPET